MVSWALPAVIPITYSTAGCGPNNPQEKEGKIKRKEQRAKGTFLLKQRRNLLVKIVLLCNAGLFSCLSICVTEEIQEKTESKPHWAMYGGNNISMVLNFLFSFSLSHPGQLEKHLSVLNLLPVSFNSRHPQFLGFCLQIEVKVFYRLADLIPSKISWLIYWNHFL